MSGRPAYKALLAARDERNTIWPDWRSQDIETTAAGSAQQPLGKTLFFAGPPIQPPTLWSKPHHNSNPSAPVSATTVVNTCSTPCRGLGVSRGRNNTIYKHNRWPTKQADNGRTTNTKGFGAEGHAATPKNAPWTDDRNVTRPPTTSADMSRMTPPLYAGRRRKHNGAPMPEHLGNLIRREHSTSDPPA